MKLRLIVFFVFTCALAQWWPLGQGRTHTRNSTSKDDSVWTWNWSEDGNSLELSVRGEVEFTDDYTNVKRLAPGSSITIREKRGGVNRRLEVEAGSGAGLIVLLLRRWAESTLRRRRKSMVRQGVDRCGHSERPRCETQSAEDFEGARSRRPA